MAPQERAGKLNGFFHAISKDPGLDPMIRYMKKRKILAQRHCDLDDTS